MVTAILISAVVLTMSVTAVTIAVHNTDASGNDRRRLQAIDASEAGIDFYYSRVLGTSYGSLLTLAGRQTLATQLSAQGYVLDTATCALTGTVGSGPAFAVTPAFYATSTATTHVPCPGSTMALSSANPNVYVVLSSVGSVGSLSGPTRTMESRARLSMGATTANFPAAAIYGAACVNLQANVDVYSASGRNDANIYVGSASGCSAGNNLSVNTRSSIRGSVYVQGSATVANGKFWARGDLWANNGVTVSGGKIDGAAISSTSTVALSGNTYVGSAKAGSTISVQNPATVYGTQSPNTSGIGPPPTFPFPTYTFNANDWPGYAPQIGCSAALTTYNAWTTGNLYMYLIPATPCTLTIPSGKDLPGNLGIISNGSITLATGAKFTNTSGTTRNVYFFSGVGASGTCGDFLANSNSGTGANIKSLIYTPSTCSATLESNSSFASGQIFSGNVWLRSNSPLTFASVDLPGSSGGSAGSLVDIVYKREITSS
jgi:hypothetical protein